MPVIRHNSKNNELIWRKFKNVDSGPKNIPNPIFGIIRIFVKNPKHSLCFGKTGLVVSGITFRIERILFQTPLGAY